MLPFARNSSTRFISPTKTPEYLAAGKPVVSTSICDVVRPYGQLGIVRIADTVVEFVAAATAAMNENPDSSRWLHQVDGFLAHFLGSYLDADDATGVQNQCSPRGSRQQ